MFGLRGYLIVAAALLLGCKGQRIDPFGRTTIPPPGTGAVAAPGYAPGGGAAPMISAPPAVSVPSTPAPMPAAPQLGPVPAVTPAPTPVPGLIAPPPGPTGAAPAAPGAIPVKNPSPPWSGTSGWAPQPASQSLTAATATTPKASPRLQPVSPFETTVAPIQPLNSPGAAPASAFAFASTPTPTPLASPVAAVIAQPAATTPSHVIVIDNGSRGEPVIRLEDASKVAALQPLPIQPTPIAAGGAGLPPAGGWTAGDARRSAAVPTAQVALASHKEASILVPSGAIRGNVTVPAAVAVPAAVSADYKSRYGKAPDFSRLKGKLEYSATRKQWKLRYVPVDAVGAPDQHGGSVVLTGLGDMSPFHDGDFAAVEGAVGKRADDAKDFAPDYQVRTIQRVP